MQKVQFQYIVFKYPVLCIFTHLYYLTPIHSDKELFSQFLWGTISSPSVCLSHFSLSMYCQVSLLSVASFPSVSFCPFPLPLPPVQATLTSGLHYCSSFLPERSAIGPPHPSSWHQSGLLSSRPWPDPGLPWTVDCQWPSIKSREVPPPQTERGAIPRCSVYVIQQSWTFCLFARTARPWPAVWSGPSSLFVQAGGGPCLSVSSFSLCLGLLGFSPASEALVAWIPVTVLTGAFCWQGTIPPSPGCSGYFVASLAACCMLCLIP